MASSPNEKEAVEAAEVPPVAVDHDPVYADQEKTGMGQAPFPTNLPEEPLPGLHRLDSQHPVAKKDKPSAEDLLDGLPEHEANILRTQLEVPTKNVGFKDLYRYATGRDWLIMAVSAICAIAAGAALPLMTVVFGNLTGTFQNFEDNPYTPALGASFSSQTSHLTLYFVYLGIAEFVTIYISTVGFIHTGENISGKIREHYLDSILRQNIGYFDKLGAGEITTRITSDTNLVQDGISEKVGLTLTALATFVAAYVIGYVKYWKLTLILTSSIVAIFGSMAIIGSFVIKFQRKSLASYAEGGTVAEEVISSVRNAVAFGTQDKLAREYDKHLAEAEHWGFRVKGIGGSMLGVLMLYVYLTYALAFWLGAQYIVKGETALPNVLTVALSIMIGAFSLGNVSPNIQAFTSAIAAANKIYATIDRVSPLDPGTDAGRRLEQLEGNVELRAIKHIYPSRPEVTVMDNVDLVVPAGKVTALVGASGSGKSTIVGLVERFYTPVGGQVLLDGVDVQDLNLRWLRQQISLVSQEPTLFATTIEGNIRHGLIGTDSEHLSDDKIFDLVRNAARMANAHDFIEQLPEGYNTNVGERGFLLSGGQKQRIAIARAIVSDPKILLLDEATSALDTKSEGVVQAALDKAARGRTTIVIAHRLSTIKGADNIVVMSRGRIVEQGTHDELLEKKAAYHDLVEAQRIAQANEVTEEEEVGIYDEMDGNLKAGSDEKASDEYASDPNDLELGRSKTGQSASSKVLAGMPGEVAHKYSLWSLLRLVAGFNRQERNIMLIGFLFCIICGGGQPTQSVFFAEIVNDLAVPPSEYSGLESRIDFWTWMYFMLACVQFFAYAIQGVALAYCSERLVHKARDKSFRTMLRQDISFFDREENNAGALTSFLSTETTHLAGISGVTLGTIMLVSTTLVAGFIVALAVDWKLALVCIATVPVVLATGYFRFSMLTRFQARSQKAYEKSAAYACEATSAIRTVASLTREQDVLAHYHDQLEAQGQASLRSILKSSLLYAASQSFMFGCIALGFWWGGQLIGRQELSLFQFFLCFQSVVFGAQSAGTIFSFAPDMGKARHAAAQMKELFDRKPLIDTWNPDGEKLEHVEGHIEFRDVHFRYPTRPEQPVLRGLNLEVRPGQYVALVGASGCGKSTTIALLERFYDPLVGGVYVDGREVSSLNVNNYRNHLALVSQEPTLYQGTIRENILLGADRPAEEVPEEAIEQACRNANIYDFIMSLPEGFNTVVGSKGSMLSGGQKQRVAIARALLRDPKILLLDEATSALDSESEKVVQAALDKAARGRTTIAVAHRLSTIQKADMIYVFDQGRIVENGTHSELIAKGGRYFELVNLQNLGKTQ